MRSTLFPPRRRPNSACITPLEACESRILLTAPAIYPQPLVAAPSSAPQPERLSSQSEIIPPPVAADYQGSWNTGGGILNLNLSGSEDAPKVKGTGTGMNVFGTAKIKGQVTGLQLDAIMKGKGTLGDVVGRFKINLSVTLSDPTHFAGTASGTFKNITIPPAPIGAIKL